MVLTSLVLILIIRLLKLNGIIYELKKQKELDFDIIETPLGDIDVNTIKANRLRLISLKDTFVMSASKYVGYDHRSAARIRTYTTILNELRVSNDSRVIHIGNFKFTNEDVINTLDLIIEHKTKSSSGWITINYDDNKTLPPENTSVLTFVPSWQDYEVSYLHWQEESPQQWQWYSGDKRLKESNWPSFWRHIDTNHAKK